MHVLVTGGTGFVGSHTIAALVRAGHGIRALVRPVIAFFFLFLFVADKFDLLAVALTDFDRTVFSSIIGFYFLLRHREKVKRST